MVLGGDQICSQHSCNQHLVVIPDTDIARPGISLLDKRGQVHRTLIRNSDTPTLHILDQSESSGLWIVPGNRVFPSVVKAAIPQGIVYWGSREDSVDGRLKGLSPLRFRLSFSLLSEQNVG